MTSNIFLVLEESMIFAAAHMELAMGSCSVLLNLELGSCKSTCTPCHESSKYSVHVLCLDLWHTVPFISFHPLLSMARVQHDARTTGLANVAATERREEHGSFVDGHSVAPNI